MKRFFIGAALLSVLLLGGILITGKLSSQFAPMAENLHRAAQAAGEGQWQQARGLAREVQRQWQQRWNPFAVVFDHEPMEQIDGQFARLEVYAQAENTIAFSALCARLSWELSSLGEEQKITWWNFL